jgi:DNA-binding transcriptional LysR family regulator
MDLWHLTVFCRVLDEKSFSRASRSLRLSQPTVSSHIRSLEDHFGCRLVDRHAREALPTAAGTLLYEFARRLLKMRDELESALAEHQGARRGHVQIGGSTIPGSYLLPRLIGDYKHANPEVSITLRIGDSAEILEDIQAGHVELGVVGARGRGREIIQVPLVEDELRVVAPPRHPWSTDDSPAITLHELCREPFISRELGSGTRKAVEEALAARGLSLRDLNVVAEMGSTQAVIQAVKAGLGVSMLSTVAVADDVIIGAMRQVPLADLELRRWFYLSWHRRRTLSPLANRFREFLQNQLMSGAQPRGEDPDPHPPDATRG